MPNHLFVAALAVATAAASPNATTESFSCAVSQLRLNAGAAEYELCTQTSTAASNYVSMQWITGSKGAEGAARVLVSFYIDGATTPSVSLFAYQLAGTASWQGFNRSLSLATQTAWSSELWGRNSKTSWVCSFPILFSKSVRITLKYTGHAGSASVWYQAHGLTAAAARLGVVPLPASARLVVQTNDLTVPTLGYLNVSHVARGVGVVAALAMVISAPNLNTLEGCFHFYPTADAVYPGQLHSTGTEDEFLSSYYFDAGPFDSKRAGLVYKTGNGIAAWRTYQDDPMYFRAGGSFVWRNGDTSDPANGLKCILQTGGKAVGNPQPADVQTISFNYVW